MQIKLRLYAVCRGTTSIQDVNAGTLYDAVVFCFVLMLQASPEGDCPDQSREGKACEAPLCGCPTESCNTSCHCLDCTFDEMHDRAA